VFGVVGETSKHPTVRQCVELISENDFSPKALLAIQRCAANFVIQSRRQYTSALRQNLSGLLEGAIAPRQFVQEFFELAEAGNLRSDIRKKLVLSLLLSENTRPSIKFLLLENFGKLPAPVRVSIVSEVIKVESGRHIEIIKEELKWLLQQEHPASGFH
jgi:DNA-binding SARP family transcriptional activator